MRSLQRVGYATVGIEIRGIPPFAKNAKDGAPGDNTIEIAGGVYALDIDYLEITPAGP